MAKASPAREAEVDFTDADFVAGGDEAKIKVEAFVEKVAHLRARATGLRQHGRDDAIGRALQQVPDQGAADAEAQHHELVDAQVVHEA